MKRKKTLFKTHIHTYSTRHCLLSLNFFPFLWLSFDALILRVDHYQSETKHKKSFSKSGRKSFRGICVAIFQKMLMIRRLHRWTWMNRQQQQHKSHTPVATYEWAKWHSGKETTNKTQKLKHACVLWNERITNLVVVVVCKSTPKIR